MNRLTKRNGIGYIARNKFCDYDAVLNDNELEAAYHQCVDKLGEYEDIDEKLGIEYPVLIKALLNGFDTKYNWQVGAFSIEIDLELKCFIDLCDKEHYYFKDYGKTWALTKEELL